MHKIKLVPDKPLYNNCDITVFDVTEGREKKRCKITVEYAQVDVKQLQEEGRDYEGAVKYYEEWIYAVVRHYIADDWECSGGLEEIMDIVKEHIQPYFQEA